MDRVRIERLVDEARAATAAGRVVRFVVVAGRLALRIERADGAQTSFVTPEERASIEAALAVDAPSLEVGGVRLVRDARAQLFRGTGADGVVLVVVDGGLGDGGLEGGEGAEALAAACDARYAWLRAHEARVKSDTARALAAIAPAWSTDVDALRASLRLAAITFEVDASGAVTLVPQLDAGALLGGHAVTVTLDGEGHVVRASI